MLQALPDLVGVRLRNGLPRQDQGGTHQRLTQPVEQRLHNGVVRHPYADALAATLQAARHLAGSLKDKGVGTRG